MFTVLWDNDGVLVNTEGLYFQACREVLASVGIDLTLDQFQEISLRRGESTFGLAAQEGIASSEIARLQEQRDRRYNELLAREPAVIDGVADVLRTLHGHVRMGVVTGSKREHFETIHAQSGLLEYMDFVLTREDYRQSKPDPEPYLTAVQRHDLRPDLCLVVEDSERGLASATAAGLPCLIVLSQWTQGGSFPGAVTVLENIAEVPDIVRRRKAEC